MQGKALWYVGPGRAELRAEDGCRRPGRARCGCGRSSAPSAAAPSAWSMPAGCRRANIERMRAPFMGGAFPFPVKYGYATVGRVEAGPADLQAAIVFALHPHQSRVHVSRPRPCSRSRQTCRRARAVLAANMETALNAVWDGAPGPADRIAIVGGGLVGLLVAYLCARLPGARRDGRRYRRLRAPSSRAALGAALRVAAAARPPIATSSSTPARTAAGLATALRLAGEEATRRRAELVRQRRRRGAARRGVPQPAAAAGIEPGRQGRTVASPALDAWAAARGGACAARRTRRSTRCLRRPSRSRTCRRGCLRCFGAESGAVCPADPLSGADESR